MNNSVNGQFGSCGRNSHTLISIGSDTEFKTKTGLWKEMMIDRSAGVSRYIVDDDNNIAIRFILYPYAMS